MKSNRALDEIQVMVICSRTILVAVTVVLIATCKTWTGSFATLVNSADPDLTAQNAASDHGLHCLLKSQEVKG